MDRKEVRDAEDAQQARLHAQNEAARRDWEARRLWAAAEAGDESARAECEALERVKKAEADAEDEARWLAREKLGDGEDRVGVDTVGAAKRKEEEV
jgi:hypothetical protein